MSLIFLLTAIVITVVDFSCRNKELSEKAKKRIEKMKRDMKYNPLIRYLLLNSLNFNFSAICVFMHANSRIESKVFAALCIILMNVCPLVLSFILYKANNVLQDKKRKNQIGTLYEGRNVEAERKHRVWLFPLVFFYRRTIFIVGTILFFDRPAL